MPRAIANGGHNEPTTSELAAYAASSARPSGDRTAEEQALVSELERKVEAIAQGWQDTGGTGGRQTAVALEVADFAGRLEAARLEAVTQWAKEAARGSRKAQAEMQGASTPLLIELARLVFEMRERVNDSPY